MEEKPVDGSQPSPFVEQPKYDFDALRDNTTQKAINAIWKVLGENADKLTHTSTKKREDIIEDHETVSQLVLEAIVANNVPECDMKHLIENFQVIIFQLFDILSRQKNELQKEFLARTIGAKDPAHPELYSREYATLGDFFAALKKVREDQGNIGYFIVEKNNDEKTQS